MERMSNPFAVAATNLATKGWTRDLYAIGPQRQRPGAICIGLAMPREGPFTTPYDLDFLRNYLRERYGQRDIIYVNDHIIQTEEEALKVLRECARRWETR